MPLLSNPSVRSPSPITSSGQPPTATRYSPIAIDNYGAVSAVGTTAYGISAHTEREYSGVSIVTTGRSPS